jgi:hypothetical protein
MFSIPYSFGALAKLNCDWMLHAQPPREWFRNRSGFPYDVVGLYKLNPVYPWLKGAWFQPFKLKL